MEWITKKTIELNDSIHDVDFYKIKSIINEFGKSVENISQIEDTIDLLDLYTNVLMLIGIMILKTISKKVDEVSLKEREVYVGSVIEKAGIYL